MTFLKKLAEQIKSAYTTVSELYESRRGRKKGCPSNDGHPNGKTKVGRSVTW